MNQIPNIEERIKALRPKLLPTTSEMDLYEREIIKVVHQQLQKARHDWLREEIVKLEEQIIDLEDWQYSEVAYDNTVGSNQTLQTIIDRYHSELDQEVSK